MSAGGNQPVISILFLFLYSEVYKSVARVPVHYPDQMKWTRPCPAVMLGVVSDSWFFSSLLLVF